MTKQAHNSIDVFEITGTDTADFLNNQIISKVATDHGVQFSAICNPKGRMVFTLVLQVHADTAWVAVDGSLSDNFLQYVNMRRFRMDLSINKCDKLLAFNHINQVEPGFEFIDPDQDFEAIEHDQFWLHMFRLQLPWITSDTSEQFIPQHLNLDQNGVIDFDKGCYPGQEIVARLHFIGQVKKRMQLINYQNSEPYPAGHSVKLPPDDISATTCAPSIRHQQQWQTQAVVRTTNHTAGS